LNIRSLANKLDDLLEVRRDQLIDVFFLVETWHDGDAVSLRRLRCDGFQVIDRPRPRCHADTTSTNHGGVAAVAVAGIRLASLDLGVTPITFEVVCVRVVSGTSTFIAAVVYRPGSDAISLAFFVEFTDVLDRLATFTDPVLLVGDINIRLERTDDSASVQFDEIMDRGPWSCSYTS